MAITDAYAAPTMLADAQKYNQVHHQPLFKPGQFSQIIPDPDGFDNADLCGAQGWYGEETLDVEAVHAMAPGAKVVYVGAPDCLGGLDEAWANTIDSHVADVITNSWTDGIDDITLLGNADVTFYEQFSTEAAITGITVNFSSGDDGDHTAGGTDLASKTVEFPADLPYVTGVGGTSVLIGSNGQWVGEHGWQTAYSDAEERAWGAARPTTPAAAAGPASCSPSPGTRRARCRPASRSTTATSRCGRCPTSRWTPTPTPASMVGETQVFPNGTYWDQYRIGGTSLSSPLLAGVVAVADQAHHHPLGFINPLYYQHDRHLGAARHRGAGLAGGPGPHRVRERAGQQPGQVLQAGDRRRADHDPARHSRATTTRPGWARRAAPRSSSAVSAARGPAGPGRLSASPAPPPCLPA